MGKVLAAKFDDDLSLIPGSYRVDGESRLLTSLQMPWQVQHRPLRFTFSPVSYVALLMRPNHPFHL